MALSAHLFVISAAIAAAASAQELSGEICLYARTGNGTEMVFSFHDQLITIRKQNRLNCGCLSKEVKSALLHIFHGIRPPQLFTQYHIS